MELLKLLNPSEIVVQIICFLLLFSFLRIFAWRKFLGILDERRQKIVSEYQRIETMKGQVEQLKAGYEAKLDKVGDEAKARIEAALIEGQKAAEGIKKEAQVGAQKILETAREQTRYELIRARESLKEDIVDLVVKTTEQVIDEKLTPEGDKKIITKFLQDLEKMP